MAVAEKTREYRAEARFQRVSPQKARLVLDLIKGRGVEEALTVAAFTKKRIAPVIHKLLTSAVDNAKYLSGEQGVDLDVDNLYVKQALANEGPRMKRIRPAPMGRAFRYQRRLTHIIQGGRAGGRQSSQDNEGGCEDRGGPESSSQENCSTEEKGREKGLEVFERKHMGQKVHPYGFRLGVNKPWRSRWFSERDYSKLLVEDVKLKAELREKLKAAGVSSVEIERPGNKLRFLIRTARPGIVIGRKGAEIEKLKTELGKRTNRDVFIDIIEVNKPELDAQLVSENIALQLEKRVSFRRAMRKSVDSALRFGCKGIKVRVSGRLNGNEIARSEWYLQGRLPLHTLRADIDYGFTEAHTTYGVIGVKTWIYRGDIYEQKRRQAPAVGTSVF
jgi:small subunit ribosomal protein S3